MKTTLDSTVVITCEPEEFAEGSEVVANEEPVKILNQGVEVWNAWRRAYPAITPVLTAADLIAVDLTGANLSGANLIWANLSGANLLNANLHSADLSSADLLDANLHGASLIHANLSFADLRIRDLRAAAEFVLIATTR